MKLTEKELLSIGAVIVYVAFFAHPAPSFIRDFLRSPLGNGIALLSILYVIVSHSLIVGLFLGIAYVITLSSTTEYLDPKQQKPATHEQPKSAGIPLPELKSILADSLKKGGRIPQQAGKSDTTKPTAVSTPKPTPPSKIEHFASF